MLSHPASHTYVTVIWMAQAIFDSGELFIEFIRDLSISMMAGVAWRCVRYYGAGKTTFLMLFFATVEIMCIFIGYFHKLF